MKVLLKLWPIKSLLFLYKPVIPGGHKHLYEFSSYKVSQVDPSGHGSSQHGSTKTSKTRLLKM